MRCGVVTEGGWRCRATIGPGTARSPRSTPRVGDRPNSHAPKNGGMRAEAPVRIDAARPKAPHGSAGAELSRLRGLQRASAGHVIEAVRQSGSARELRISPRRGTVRRVPGRGLQRLRGRAFLKTCVPAAGWRCRGDAGPAPRVPLHRRRPSWRVRTDAFLPPPRAPCPKLTMRATRIASSTAARRRPRAPPSPLLYRITLTHKPGRCR